MIRVTHILWLDEGPSRPPFSGAENHIMMLLPALRARNVDVELLVVLFRSGPLIEKKLHELEQAGIKVNILEWEMKRRWYYLWLRTPISTAKLAWRLIQRRRRIIHIHLDFVIAPIAAFFARCQNIVLTIHNDEPWFQKRWHKLWLRFLDTRVRHYIAISGHVRNYYAHTVRVPQSRITRVYYGIEPINDVAPKQVLRRRIGLPEDAFVIGFVGRLTVQKNIPLFMEAIRNMPDVMGVVVGDGELRSELECQAGGIPNFLFIGYRTDARELIASFDVFCLPSRYEGFGLVLVEAMLQKIPIIGSNAGAIPEICGNGEYGFLFDCGNLESLIERIRTCKQNPQKAQELAKKAYEYASRTFTVEKMAAMTIRVYEMIISRCS